MVTMFPFVIMFTMVTLLTLLTMVALKNHGERYRCPATRHEGTWGRGGIAPAHT
jgi:hypothetical protein